MARSVSAPFDEDSAKRAVIKVGDGRGFIMEAQHRVPIPKDERRSLRLRTLMRRRVVVTASHCLPNLPTPPFAQEEATYALLGPLMASNSSVMAECEFADPIADVAVLGVPDGQCFEDADTAFESLVDGAGVLHLGDMAQDAPGWLLSLDGHWTRCTLQICRGPYGSSLWIKAAAGGIVGGMSGSPILLDDGRVVGVISTSAGTQTEPHTEGGPQPWLTHCLPGELLRQIAIRHDKE